jgi:hypothetical protein
MKSSKIKCETCQLRGYSPDFCKVHQKKISDVDVENCHPQPLSRRVGKTVALGAGVGVVVATVGIAAVPAVGLKAAIGHALAVKLTAGGGAAGAGINVARSARKNHPGPQRDKKNRVLLPLYLKRGS